MCGGTSKVRGGEISPCGRDPTWYFERFRVVAGWLQGGKNGRMPSGTREKIVDIDQHSISSCSQ